jgi:death on curing protein
MNTVGWCLTHFSDTTHGGLDRNGWDIVAPKEEVYFTFLHLAEGTLSEAELADWFRKHAISL